MTELDHSTGRPRVTWDNTPEIASKYAELYADRKGEILHVLFVGHLTALGQCFGPGDRLEVEVGSKTWWETVDAEGRSFLDLAPDAQIARHRRVMYLTGTEPPDPRATRSPIADQTQARPMPKGEAQMLANLRKAWEEEDEMAKQPVRWESRHH